MQPPPSGSGTPSTTDHELRPRCPQPAKCRELRAELSWGGRETAAGRAVVRVRACARGRDCEGARATRDTDAAPVGSRKEHSRTHASEVARRL
eukprot:2792241-Pleurochrysis_carterae.AAC.1